MKDQKKPGFVVLDDQTKDELAIKVLRCFYGVTPRDILGQLEYTKDFLMTRMTINSFGDSVIVEERRRLEKERKNLKALLEQGLSQAEIARRCGCTRQAVHIRIHHETRPKEHLRWAKYARVYWFLIQGLPPEEIAKRVGYSKSTVSSLKLEIFPHLRLRPGRRSASAGTI